MVKKDKKVKAEIKEYKVDSRTMENIHVMPDQFYVTPKKNWGKVIFLIGITIVVLIIVVGLAIFLNTKLKKNGNDDTNTNVNVDTNTNVNANTNVNVDTNTNVNANTNVNVDTNTNVNANTNVNTNVNANTNTNTAPPRPGSLPLGPDSDKDNLTTLEEGLYGSQINKADTDSDGYLDGDEVKNGYDPGSTSLTLLASNLVSEYSNNDYNYSLIYPTDWIFTPAESGRKIVFNTRAGSLMEVSIVDNPNQLNLSNLYQNRVRDSAAGDLIEISFGNFTGVKDASRLTYLISLAGKTSIAYEILYKPGSRTTLDFITTFEMMVNSFNVE